jgi:hypothetical protein
MIDCNGIIVMLFLIDVSCYALITADSTHQNRLQWWKVSQQWFIVVLQWPLPERNGAWLV